MRQPVAFMRAKQGVKKARQMIDRHLFTITFVVYVDVIDMVKRNGVTDQAEAERRAHRICCEYCFSLFIYRTAEGEEKTSAEFMREWLQSGYSWEASIAHLRTLSPTNRKRDLSPTFRENAIQRLRDNIARN